MPTGKVKWYDVEKGFGFLSTDEGSDVFVRASALPEGVPCLLCPAMNTAMWNHPVVRRNLAWIAALDRYEIVAPSAKRLACGDVGVGGLAEVPDIVSAIQAYVQAPEASQAR